MLPSYAQPFFFWLEMIRVFSENSKPMVPIFTEDIASIRILLYITFLHRIWKEARLRSMIGFTLYFSQKPGFEVHVAAHYCGSLPLLYCLSRRSSTLIFLFCLISYLDRVWRYLDKIDVRNYATLSCFTWGSGPVWWSLFRRFPRLLELLPVTFDRGWAEGRCSYGNIQ